MNVNLIKTWQILLIKNTKYTGIYLKIIECECILLKI